MNTVPESAVAEPPFGGPTTAALSDTLKTVPESAVAEPPFGGPTPAAPSDTLTLCQRAQWLSLLSEVQPLLISLTPLT